MSQCAEVHEWLSADLDGELTDPRQRALLEAHLRQCQECQSTQAAYRDLGRRISRLPTLKAPAGLHPRLPRPAPLPSLLAAAGIFVLCGLGIHALRGEQTASDRLVAERVAEGHYRLQATVSGRDTDPQSQIRLLVDSGNLPATVSYRLRYDLDGDGTIDREDPSVSFRTDSQTGYQEIERTVRPGVWKGGRVYLDVEAQPPVELAFAPDCEFRP